MKMKWLALVTAAALSLTACGDKNKQASDEPVKAVAGNTAEAPKDAEKPAEEAKPEVKPVVSSGNFLADATALQAAEDALKALPQFGGKPLNIFQNIHFYGGKRPRITVEIQDPNKPENIDHYEFEDGKWSEPQPVRISGNGNMKDNVFPLDEIKFADIAKIAQAYGEKAKAAGAELVPVDGLAQSLTLIEQKRADATLNDELAVLDYLKKNPNAGVKIVWSAPADEKVGSGLIVNKGNDEVVAKFSTAINELKADGTLKKLGEQFFGKDISVK